MFLHSKLSHAGISNDPWWWNSTLRLFAVIFGALVGYISSTDAIAIVLGAASGVLNVSIVAVIRAKLKTTITSRVLAKIKKKK
jgi:hypothetical protein